MTKSIKWKIEVECFCQIYYHVNYVNYTYRSIQFTISFEWIVQAQDENNRFIMSYLTIMIVSEQTVTTIEPQ